MNLRRPASNPREVYSFASSGKGLPRHRCSTSNAVTVGADVHLGTLKSGKDRTVVLPKFVVDEIAKTCRGKGHGDLIWAARDGGHLGPPSSHDSWLSGAVDRCQTAALAARDKEGDEPTTAVFPRVTAHALRHTAASLAISAGANVKVVQRMWGSPAQR